MARLLLVEDDEAIAGPLARALVRDGHEVVHVRDGESAVGNVAAYGHAIDLVVLDVGLPGIDGVEVCRLAREHRPDLPVLMLTARASEHDELAGLEAGADDYVTKPFQLAVLHARIAGLLRRSAPAPNGTPPLRAGNIRVDVSGRRAWHGDRELGLTPKEFDLLELLVRRAGVVVRREEIMREVWETEWIGSTKTLDVHVAALRRKLDVDPSPVATVRGVGLRIETS